MPAGGMPNIGGTEPPGGAIQPGGGTLGGGMKPGGAMLKGCGIELEGGGMPAFHGILLDGSMPTSRGGGINIPPPCGGPGMLPGSGIGILLGGGISIPGCCTGIP